MIFVGGIHGVGKTTICKQIEKNLGVLHLSSSKLIAEKRNETFTDKKIKNINNNQDYLIEAIKEYKTKEIDYLLDGHFCLLNSFGDVVKIPIKTFEDLSPSAILLIKDTQNNIVQRLYKRDGKKYSEEFIDVFQSKEIDYSREVSQKLNIPHLVINNEDNSENINKIVQKILKKEFSF